MFDELSLRKQVIFLQEQLLELSEAVTDAEVIMDTIRHVQANLPPPFAKNEVFTMAGDWLARHKGENHCE